MSEGVVWHVPNGEIHRVGNKSQQWSRAVIDVAIRYDADVDAATRVIRKPPTRSRRDAEFGHVILDEPDVLGIESLSPDTVIIRVVVQHPSSGGGAGGACAAGPDQGRARRGRDLGAHGVGTPLADCGSLTSLSTRRRRIAALPCSDSAS